MFVIRVRVRFYELFPSIIKLGICMCQKRKAVYCLLSEHFPAIDLTDLFQDGVSDASKGCHALNNRRLHFLEFQVLQPDGGTEVVPNQLVNPNFRQTFTVFWLQVFVKLVLQPFF